jgi:leucyl/phenylalanyl-tRNA---protein transferase
MRPAERRSRFPDPSGAPPDAPLGWGGDLEPGTLLDAYRHGIFPWPSGGELFWWSPDPRAVIPLDGLHVSRSLRRALRSGRFVATANRACRDVLAACAHRPGEETWITPAMIAAYGRLHTLGHVHSVEVWDRDDRLVGGLYGVSVGAAFSGESMFHRVSDASKVALVYLVERLRARGFTLLDAQLPTPHLERLGARAVTRARFLRLLAAARDLPVTF